MRRSRPKQHKRRLKSGRRITINKGVRRKNYGFSPEKPMTRKEKRVSDQAVRLLQDLEPLKSSLRTSPVPGRVPLEKRNKPSTPGGVAPSDYITGLDELDKFSRQERDKKIRERSKEWHSRNPDYLKDYFAQRPGYKPQWRKENPERVREISIRSHKTYREKHPERVRASSLKWRKNNPEKVRELWERDYARDPEKPNRYKAVKSGLVKPEFRSALVRTWPKARIKPYKYDRTK